MTFRSRALQQIQEREEPQVKVEGLKQLPSTSSPSGPPGSSYNVVVIPSAETKSSLNTDAKEKLAMVSLLSLADSHATDGRALDLYKEPALNQSEALSYDDLVGAYKKILLSSNFSLEVGASYFFCPSPVQIHHNLFPSKALVKTDTKAETK